MKYESDFRALREEYESLQGQLAALEKEKDDMSLTLNQNVAEKETIIQSLNSQLIEAQKLAELQRKELNFSSLSLMNQNFNYEGAHYETIISFYFLNGMR